MLLFICFIFWCDNIGVIYLLLNSVFYVRIKYIEIDFYFVRDQVLLKKLNVLFLFIKDQIADLLIKLLVSVRFVLFRDNFYVQELFFRLRGRVGIILSDIYSAVSDKD